MKKKLSALLGLSALLLAAGAHAEDGVYRLTLKNHRFEPQALEIPAQKKVKLLIKNLDATAEEFDSNDLHREKVIPPGQEAVVFIGPLSAGQYKFQGEYNAATAQGVVTVK